MPARKGKLPRGWVAGPAKPPKPKGKAVVLPAPVQARAAADGTPLMRDGAPNPTGRGRYCPPALCWCGSCPHWTPAPPVNYGHAIARLQRAAAFLPPDHTIEED